MTRTLESVRYHYGQLLSARDLQDDLQAENQRRWWHTVALHNTWGIALGLDLILDRTMRVTPGLAYDRLGRELIFTKETPVSLSTENWRPGQPSDGLVLVMHHDLAPGTRSPSASSFHCLTSQPDAPPEQAALRWRRPSEVQLGLEIPLARVGWTGTAMEVTLDVRQYARPWRRPYTAAGQTPPGTPWQPWPDGADEPLGWSIDVNTSDAGFQYIPHYFARFASQRPELTQPLLGPFTFVENLWLASFTFVVLFATSSPGYDWPGLDRFFNESAPTVAWVGIEPTLVCGYDLAGWASLDEFWAWARRSEHD